MRPTGDQNKLQLRREKAIEMVFNKGITQIDAAKELKVNPRTVREWVQSWRQWGREGIERKKNEGRPCCLTQKQKESLRDTLMKGAKTVGYANELWTCRRVGEVIKKCYGVNYHFNHVGKILHLLGFTVQKPQLRAIERDEKVVTNWITKQWPRIKKNRHKKQGNVRVYRRKCSTYAPFGK